MRNGLRYLIDPPEGFIHPLAFATTGHLNGPSRKELSDAAFYTLVHFEILKKTAENGWVEPWSTLLMATGTRLYAAMVNGALLSRGVPECEQIGQGLMTEIRESMQMLVDKVDAILEAPR